MKQVSQFLQKAEQIAKSRIKELENFSSFTAQIPPVFVLPYDKFRQKYGSNLYLNGEFDVLVFDGDLTLPTLNSSWLAEQFKQTGGDNERQAMFVNGNLLVEGDITDDDYLFLQVAKDVSCRYLHSQNGNIVIGGDLSASQGISGEYNDGMLQVLGKTRAPYIVSNDHAMPNNGTGEYIYIQDGRIGKSYHGALEGWEFYEDSEAMFKEGIYKGDYQIDIPAFFKMIKNGENPFVDFKTFEANKAAWNDEQEEFKSDLEGSDESQSIAEILYLENFSGSDDELYRHMIGEYEAVEKISDENEKYAQGGRAFMLSIIAARMVENWRLITERYPAEKVEILRKNIIKGATDLAGYFLKIGDKKQLSFIYQFLNDELVGIEEDEPYLYETLVRAGLALQKYEEAYLLLRSISKSKLEIVKNLNDVIESEKYQTWRARQ